MKTLSAPAPVLDDKYRAERLTSNLVWMAEHLERHDELETSPLLLEQLERISVSTVGRRLAVIRQDEPRLPRRGPKRANRLTRDIPMTRIPWIDHLFSWGYFKSLELELLASARPGETTMVSNSHLAGEQQTQAPKDANIEEKQH